MVKKLNKYNLQRLVNISLIYKAIDLEPSAKCFLGHKGLGHGHKGHTVHFEIHWNFSFICKVKGHKIFFSISCV